MYLSASTTTWLTMIAPVVAAISLGFNIYMGLLLRRERTHVVKIEEVRLSLRSMLDSIDGRLFNIPAIQEQWDQGFVRLAKIVPACAKCCRTFAAARNGLVPNDVQRSAGDINSSAAALYLLQDSFHQFQAGRSFIPYADLKNWRDLDHATTLLHALQGTKDRHIDRLENYLAKLSR